MFKKGKWIVFLCILLFICSSCNKKEAPVLKNEPSKKPDTEMQEKPLPIGLYYKQDNKRYLAKEYESTWMLNQDLLLFTAFGTNERELPVASILDLFPVYWTDTYTSYHIGYEIAYQKGSGETIKKTILSPEDTKDLYSYIQIYLYDDIHQQKGVFYTHLEEMKTETLLTSIKLTGSTFTYDIVSPIELTVFLYQHESDFDKDGFYQGVHQYQTIIHKKNIA